MVRSRPACVRRATILMEALSRSRITSYNVCYTKLLRYAEKMPWARFGVYVTHASILIIFLGAILGSYNFV